MKLHPQPVFAPDTEEGASLDDIAINLIMQRPEKEAKEGSPAEKAPAPQAKAEKPAPDQIQEPDEAEEEAPKAEALDPEDDLNYVEDEDAEKADEKAEDDDENVNVDELPIEVVVDGETIEVPLKELKANYSGNQAIERRLQEASEAKNVAIHQGNTLYQALGATAQRLAIMDKHLSTLAEPKVDWEKMRREDPARYLIEKDKARDAAETRMKVQREAAEVNRRQQELQQLAYQEYSEIETKNLVERMPELRDPQKASALMSDMSDAAQFYGYSKQEVDEVMDHRHMMVLADAAKYRKLLARKTEAKQKLVPQAPRALLRPASSAAASAPRSQADKARKALIANARRSGKVDDVAKLLLVKKK